MQKLLFEIKFLKKINSSDYKIWWEEKNRKPDVVGTGKTLDFPCFSGKKDH
jgi:hypothetical protein